MTKYIVIALSFLFLAGCGQSNSGLNISCYSGDTLIYQASDVSLNIRLLDKDNVLNFEEPDGKPIRIMGAACVIKEKE